MLENDPSNPMKVTVVGGGIFGAMTATKLAEAGAVVTLFERLPALMQGTTSVANRVHQGFHYPRDERTARQCMRGFEKFKEEFPSAILPGVFNTYFIAREGSLTSPAEFLNFCRRMNLPCCQIDPDRFQPIVRNVSLGLITEEVMFNPAVLRRLLSERLHRSGVQVRYGTEVMDIRRAGSRFDVFPSGEEPISFDAVVNCCYADRNRLTARLNHCVESALYEYVVVPIIELEVPQPVSISVLDGPFMCLLPFGASSRYLLYHAQWGVIARENAPLVNREWFHCATSPFATVNKREWFEALLDICREYIPALRGCRLQGFVERTRMVLADSVDTDARPSVLTQHEPGYISVFSGKVGHCTWVVDEIASKLGLSDQPREHVHV